MLLALGGDVPARVDRFDVASGLELLKDGPDNLTAALAEVLWSNAVVLVGAVSVLKLLDGGLWVEVDLPDDGGSADVPPVGVVWWHLLEASGLGEIGPLWSLDNLVILDVLSELGNESISWNFTNVRALVASSSTNHRKGQTNPLKDFFVYLVGP